MRLLVPSDDGYEPNRGFETCQLKSRHWTLFVEGREQTVDGDGAIGMYPLLREGSYREDSGQSATQVEPGDDQLGVFSYQSMANDNSEGQMRGYFTFVPGSLAEPTGVPFDVEVAPFPLDRNPEFFFCN
jgi:F-box protein 3